MQSIAIDFDGVIHTYSEGWKDGSIYDKPVEGVFEFIEKLFEKDYSVFVFSTRKPEQIKNWLIQHTAQDYLFAIQVIPFYTKFWNKSNVLGITRRKLPAKVYIDDRAFCFKGSFENMELYIDCFKTWQEKGIYRTEYIMRKHWLIIQDSFTIHVIPENDVKEHVCKMDCGCEPKITALEKGTLLFVHASFDGREAMEEFNAALKNA